MRSSPSPNPCFICLDESTEESCVQAMDFALYDDVPCSCQVSCHMDCWTSYYTKKGGFECPICHSKVILSPHSIEHVIVIQPDPVHARVEVQAHVQTQRDDCLFNFTSDAKYMLACIVFAAIVIIIIIRPK